MNKLIEAKGWQVFVMEHLLTDKVRATFVVAACAVIVAGSEALIGWMQRLSEVPPGV